MREEEYSSGEGGNKAQEGLLWHPLSTPHHGALRQKRLEWSY